MRVVPVPVLRDNYAYLLISQDHKTAACVDPAEPQKVLAAAKQEGVHLSHILTTHHHFDHAGGNLDFVKLQPDVVVIGGANDGVPGCTQTVQDGGEFKLGSISIRCIDTPFHTKGHMCFACEEAGSRLVFTGDTLFVGGCGRCFVGTPEQMHTALVGKLSKLPGDTQVWCGHEYTVKNLEFALDADKGNQAVADKLTWARQQREAGQPTVPSTIKAELAHNPFMRCGDTQLAAAWESQPGPALLGKLRAAKDASEGAVMNWIVYLLTVTPFGRLLGLHR